MMLVLVAAVIPPIFRHTHMRANTCLIWIIMWIWVSMINPFWYFSCIARERPCVVGHCFLPVTQMQSFSDSCAIPVESIGIIMVIASPKIRSAPLKGRNMIRSSTKPGYLQVCLTLERQPTIHCPNSPCNILD